MGAYIMLLKMKIETKLFWKFFIQQKAREIWCGILQLFQILPYAALITTAILILVFLVGNAAWGLCNLTGNCKIPWSIGAMISIGISTSMSFVILFAGVDLFFRWVKDNVKEAKGKVIRMKERGEI